jgi:hypothetical protein
MLFLVETCSSWLIYSEGLPLVKLEMDQHNYFGQIFGMIIFFSRSSQGISFVKNKNIYVAQFLLNNQLERQFHLPLSVQAFEEYQQLQQLIQQLQVSEKTKDTWHYIWGNSKYTTSKFYHLPYKNVHPPRSFIWIWDSSCANKKKVFTWLLLMDRLNVRNILRRKKHKLQGNNYNYVLYSAQCEETTFHFFSLALLVWNADST